MSNKNPNRFYVYIYFDPRKPGKFNYGSFEFDFEPFYVGKGTNNRFKLHINEALSDHWTNERKCERINSILSEKLNPIIKIIINNLNEYSALKIENEYISTIKVVENNGPLLNLFKTGNSPVGISRDKLSNSIKIWWDSDDGAEKRERLSNRMIQYNKSIDINGINNPNFGNKWNEEQRKYMSNFRKEHKMSVGKNNPKFKYMYKIIVNNKQIITDSLKLFCEQNNYEYEVFRTKTRNSKNGGYINKSIFIERFKLDN